VEVDGDKSGSDLGDLVGLGCVEPRLVSVGLTDVECPPALDEFSRRHLGKPLMEWQRIALAGQLAADEAGDLRFREALISTARQNGKSIALQALAGWWLTDEAPRRKDPQSVLLVANKIDRSMPMFRTMAAILEESFGATVRWANGSQAVTMPDGSTFKIAAAKDNHHGGTYDLILVDELWDIQPSVIFDALRPSMIARRNPLLSMWSTAGDESSATMLRLRSQAIADIDAGRSSRLYFAEWSMPPGVDPTDRRYWRNANPALGTTITLDALEAMADGNDRAAFMRAHLNLWVSAAKSWLPFGLWDQQTTSRPMPEGGILAVDSSIDDSRYVGVRAAATEDGVQLHVEFIVDTEEAMWERIRGALENPNVTLSITPGLELHTPFPLKRRTTTFGYGEIAKYTDLIRKAIHERRVWHDGSVSLGEHMNRAVLVKTAATVVVSSQKSPGPIELCRCAIIAAALASRPAQRMRPAFASS